MNMFSFCVKRFVYLWNKKNVMYAKKTILDKNSVYKKNLTFFPRLKFKHKPFNEHLRVVWVQLNKCTAKYFVNKNFGKRFKIVNYF